MAITLADFNKIWSSTSPLSPYTFSDDNYNEGWNFIGQIPPSRQMWDFLQKNNDEKMKYLADNYLPLSGGTMTGRINSFGADNREFKMGLSDTSATSCDIGWDFGTFAGAMFSLRSASYGSSDAGGFNLYARKDNNNAVLTGFPDGTLKWNGYDITPYRKKGNAPSITVPEGTYILVAYQYGYGVPSQTAVYVGLIGGGDFNDGTQHIGVVDILKGSNFAGLGLSYSITTDSTKQITVSLTSNNSNITLIRVM